MKICTKCNKKQELSEYTKDEIQKSGLRPSCRSCDKLRFDPISKKKYNQRYYQENKDKYARVTEEQKQKQRESCRRYMKNNSVTMRNSYLKRSYGITADEYNDMFIMQGGRCAICGMHQCEFKRRLGVDHDHETGVNRGLLCHKCNTAIGSLGDNIKLLQNAIKYLKQDG